MPKQKNSSSKKAPLPKPYSKAKAEPAAAVNPLKKLTITDLVSQYQRDRRG